LQGAVCYLFWDFPKLPMTSFCQVHYERNSEIRNKILLLSLLLLCRRHAARIFPLAV